MAGQMFEVNIAAIGEVRDADGNLISSEPITATLHVTADELAALTEGNPS